MLKSIAQVLSNMGENETAAAVYEHVIAVEPGVAPNYLHAGVVWRAAHDDQKAVNYLEKALQLDPLLEECYEELIGIYSTAQNPEKLRQIIERYLTAFPKSLEAQAEFRNLSLH